MSALELFGQFDAGFVAEAIDVDGQGLIEANVANEVGLFDGGHGVE